LLRSSEPLQAQKGVNRVYFGYLATGIDIHAEKLHSIRLAGQSEVGLRAAYGAAMRREHSDMPLSKRGGIEYLALREQRRKDLKALLRAGIDEHSREKALDIVCTICEESVWAEKAESMFGDDAHPAIDLMAAQTASLIAWAVHEGGFTLNVQARILSQLRRRIFTPLMAHDDYAAIRPDSPRALTTVCEIITAALLTETDATRLFSLMRMLSRIADDIIAMPNAWPLKDALADWTAATALWRIARIMTGPQALARALPVNEWLDALLYSYLGDGNFIDPCGGGILNDLNGADVFFLGASAGDEAVEALGAALCRAKDAELTCLSALLVMDAAADMSAVTKQVPRFRHAAVSDNSVMTARGAGAYITMVSGGRGNAGGMCAYMDDSPVLYACDSAAVTVNGRRLADKPGVGDSDFDDIRADMSVDMTSACPREAGVRFMQRTVMLERDTGVARMIDMLECVSPGEIVYEFASPVPPRPEGGGARMGKGFISWDPGARAEYLCRSGDNQTTEGMFCLKLSYPLEQGRNMFNFIIERA